MNSSPYDVVVVGAGNAALCAALAAQEKGAKVLVLERAPQDQRGGNGAYTGGGFRMVHHGLEDIKKFVLDLSEDEIANTDFGEYPADRFFDDLGSMTQYRIDPDLAEVLVHRSTDTVQWLRQKTKVRMVPRYGVGGLKHEGRFKFFSGTVIGAVGGGAGLIEAEFKAAEGLGIAIRYDTRATTLLYGRGGVEGVRVIADRVEEDTVARSVVPACGGSEANGMSCSGWNKGGGNGSSTAGIGGGTALSGIGGA